MPRSPAHLAARYVNHPPMQNPVTPIDVAPSARSASAAAAKSAFRFWGVIEEMTALTAYRQCKVDYFPFIDDFTARKGEEAVDREALLAVLTDFLKANNLKVDWEGVESAPNEALVNALAMMSPYGPAEKQAMLEAPDLKTRAEILIAVTEMDLAKTRTSGDPPLQ